MVKGEGCEGYFGMGVKGYTICGVCGSMRRVFIWLQGKGLKSIPFFHYIKKVRGIYDFFCLSKSQKDFPNFTNEF